MRIEFAFSCMGFEPAEAARQVSIWVACNSSWLVPGEAGYVVVTDCALPPSHLGRAVRVPRRDTYDIARYSNVCIRSSTADVVVKTDLDIALSPEAVAASAAVAPDSALVQSSADIPLAAVPGIAREGHEASWDPSLCRPQGRGASFAMRRECWHLLRGYDERHRGWGGDDDDLWRRARATLSRAEQRNCHPVWHRSHEPRISDRFPARGAENLEISASTQWHETFESRAWGMTW